ncbi:MAG: threonine/serine dehydratase [Thermaerobacterales bacterium]
MPTRTGSSGDALPDALVTLDDIQAARQRLQGVLEPTFLQRSRTFGRMSAMQVFLKPENLQKTGSFKVRGAFNAIAQMTSAAAVSENQNAPGAPSRPAAAGVAGVITASSGNHAQAVAFSAARMGLPAVVVMPEQAPALKVRASRGYGAEVILHGRYPDQRIALAREVAVERGYVFVDSTEDLAVIAGQGSIGLEILDEAPDVDAIVTPIGGGGLISGLAAAVKLTRPAVRVIGVEPTGAAAMHTSLARGRPTALDTVESVADGLWARKPGALCYAHTSRFVDDVVLVEEEEILDALCLLAERAKLVVEPSGAVPLAALLAGRINVPGVRNPRVAVVLTGGNIPRKSLANWLNQDMRVWRDTP